MEPTRAGLQSFFQKANDLRCRGWPYRLNRFLRAKLRNGCAKGLLFADDPRVLRAWRKGWDPQHYLRLLRWRDQGFNPSCIYDIGANVGVWSEMCQSLFHPGQIYLFEPQPQLQGLIRQRQLDPGSDWKILPFAVGDQDEINTFHLTQNPAASSLLAPNKDMELNAGSTSPVGQIKVQVLRLDDLVVQKGLARPDLVKIDVQGFEDRVLIGGANTLNQAQRLVIEVSLRTIYKDQALLPGLLNRVVELGYELEDMSEACRQWPAGGLWQVDLWLKRSEAR